MINRLLMVLHGTMMLGGVTTLMFGWLILLDDPPFQRATRVVLAGASLGTVSYWIVRFIIWVAVGVSPWEVWQITVATA